MLNFNLFKLSSSQNQKELEKELKVEQFFFFPVLERKFIIFEDSNLK